MKKSIKFGTGVTMLLTLALTGCGDGDSAPGVQAAYQQGTNKCSQQFVSDYNNLILIFKRAHTESEVDAAQNAANQFGSTYKDVVCQAVVYDGSNQEAMINVNDNVAVWNAAIADYRAKHFSGSSAQQPAHAPSHGHAPSETPMPSTDLRSLSNGITLQIYDSSAFNPASARGSRTMAIQNGRLISYSELDTESSYCTILYFQDDTGIRAGSRVKLIASAVTAYSASFRSESYSLSLICNRSVASRERLTIDDINQALGLLATASFSQ